MLTMIAVAVGVVTAIGGGVWQMEIRYAKESELVQHIQQHEQWQKEINGELLESRRQSTRRDIFTLEEAGRQRPLSQQERWHLEELRQLEKDTVNKMNKLGR